MKAMLVLMMGVTMGYFLACIMFASKEASRIEEKIQNEYNKQVHEKYNNY